MVRTDEELINGLIGKDEFAINRFIDLHASYLYNVIFRVVRIKEDAEEATQDAIVKILNNIEKFDYSCQLKTWMYTIAQRTAIDRKRKIKITDDIDTVYGHSTSDRSDSILLNNELSDQIELLLDNLNEDDRKIVSLFYLNELSTQEVAEICDMSIGNVKVKLFRARKTLASYAEKLFGDEI